MASRKLEPKESWQDGIADWVVCPVLEDGHKFIE